MLTVAIKGKNKSEDQAKALWKWSHLSEWYASTRDLVALCIHDTLAEGKSGREERDRIKK